MCRIGATKGSTVGISIEAGVSAETELGGENGRGALPQLVAGAAALAPTPTERADGFDPARGGQLDGRLVLDDDAPSTRPPPRVPDEDGQQLRQGQLEARRQEVEDRRRRLCRAGLGRLSVTALALAGAGLLAAAGQGFGALVSRKGVNVATAAGSPSRPSASAASSRSGPSSRAMSLKAASA